MASKSERRSPLPETLDSRVTIGFLPAKATRALQGKKTTSK
jgi:hypothetical protein